MRDKLKELLIRHEGLVKKPYKDTVGKLTIGVGRNLDDVGITKDEALYLLDNDIDRVEDELKKFDWFNELDEVRQVAIIDMCFNLGLSRFLQFKKTIEALKDKDWGKAAEEMLNSKWAKQVGNRAVELSEMIKKGEFI